jgi:hypothetical protein
MKKILVAIALLSSAAAIAKPYGKAGCGLGSIVIGKNGNQVLAATSNATGGQVFGISSGTSNCEQARNKKMALAPYVEHNKAQLLTEMAKGRGESLSGLAQLMGCRDQSQFNALLQHSLPQGEEGNLSEHLYQVVGRTMASECTLYL